MVDRRGNGVSPSCARVLHRRATFAELRSAYYIATLRSAYYIATRLRPFSFAT